MNFTFDKMEKQHRKAVTDILNYYIENTTAAYRKEAVEEDFVLELMEGAEVYRSFVIKNEAGDIVGFCLLEPHSPLSTFSAAAEVMYFIHENATGMGAGGQALKKLEDEARKLGVKKLLADISSENSGSIRFHKKNGFVEYGKLDDIGCKFGRNFGVVYLAKDLCAPGNKNI